MVQLDSTVLSVKKRTSAIRIGAVTSVDMKGLSRLPSFLGNADPLRFVRMLPGVQTGSELDAGMHIQGSDHGHNLVSMDGVPVYGPAHLLGIFSTFIPSHFGGMSFSASAGHDNRLGGVIDLQHDASIPDAFHAQLNAGLVSAQGTLSLPLRKNAALRLSGRSSFLGLIYGPWMKIDGVGFDYGFGDVNASLVMNAGPHDHIWLDIYHGHDMVGIPDISFGLNTEMEWGNFVTALHWKHAAPSFSMENCIYASRYDVSLEVSHESLHGRMPSYIGSMGYKGNAKWKNWNAGAEAALHNVLEQTPDISSDALADAAEASPYNVFESSLWAGYTLEAGYRWLLSASLKGGFFFSAERKLFLQLSPKAEISYRLYRAGTLTFSAGIDRQNLFQNGLTSLGFPIESWYAAGRLGDPQSSLYGTLGYKASFAADAWVFTASLYCRRLFNQLEYVGTLFDMLSANYDLANVTSQGNGWNCGLGLMLHKQAGRLNGWVGYTLGRSLRDVGMMSNRPSSYERIHEFNLVASWDGGRWDAGGSLVAASGTPYTAPEAMYLIGNRVLCDYGKYNGSRLKPYIRLDLDFNWYFRKDARFSHGVNFSVYNALGRDNEIARKLSVKSGSDGGYRGSYSPFSFSLKWMPAVAWFCKF